MINVETIKTTIAENKEKFDGLTLAHIAKEFGVRPSPSADMMRVRIAHQLEEQGFVKTQHFWKTGTLRKTVWVLSNAER